MKALVPLLLLAGCATAAIPERAPPELPAGFTLPAVPAQGPSLASRLAHDPALPRLLTAAEAGSPDLETAAARVRQARAELAGARAASAPNTRASASLDRYGFGEPGGGVSRNSTVISPVVEVRWELDLFGRLRATRGAAKARLSAATADAAATRLALDTEIARNLVAIRILDARSAAAGEAIESARALDRLARVRAEAGLATSLDTATTAADVAAAEAATAPLLAARQARVSALMQLTALPSSEIAALLLPVRPPPAPGDWAIPDVPSNLLQRRPDITASFQRLVAADQQVAVALAQRYPDITLTGSLRWLTTTLSGLVGFEGLTGSVGAAISGPLLDFGRTAAEVELSRGAAAEAAGLYRGAVLGALAEVETFLAEARGAARQADDLRRAAEALTGARRVAEIQYRGGLTDARAVSEAARRLADARDRHLVADGLAVDAALSLELATGGSLSAP